MAKPRADRVMANLIEGAERPMPAWIKKKQPARVMLSTRVASVDSQTGSVVNARDSLAASQSVASLGTTGSPAKAGVTDAQAANEGGLGAKEKDAEERVEGNGHGLATRGNHKLAARVDGR